MVVGDSARMEQQCRLWPVEEPARLDSLRKTMDLMPIGEYLRAVEEVYGSPCRWDPLLDVEQLEVLRADE